VFVFICFMFSVALSAQTDTTVIPGTTSAIVNLRSGPGTGFDVVTVIPSRVPVEFIGRNDSSTGLLVRAEGSEGWLSYTYATVDGRVNDLPIVSANAVAPPVVQSSAAEQNTAPSSPETEPETVSAPS